jgi:hypothetical protein
LERGLSAGEAAKIFNHMDMRLAGARNGARMIDSFETPDPAKARNGLEPGLRRLGAAANRRSPEA